MAIPHAADARLYYRCAFKRYEEAQVLFKAGYSNGAVYLGGYGIECILKALVLATAPVKARSDILNSFKGSRAHEYVWLRNLYLTNGGSRPPREFNQYFALVNEWSTDLRYLPRTIKDRDAEKFLTAAFAILQCVDGRL